ncbi:sporulation protein [Catenuloplanes indicus]|uniref:Uncharacterized protein n=1 Tax=Catenuloplanes indicus TaxID=137267 RepID=A0AAE3W6I3_9ACTN|nr:sporulation protein [Catenuloplanes indicus]MDQ0370828.1 hypothetical protein [Catenuloplanes indicus]
MQERILDAFARLDFGFVAADLERGRLSGVAQTLPSYQEIEFRAAPRYAHGDADRVDFTAVVDGWMREAAARMPATGGHHYAEHHEDDGPGWGGVALGAAGGLAAGLVADEVFEEIFEDEEED